MRGGPRLHYRLYFLGPNGRFAGVVEFEARDDEDALARLGEYRDGRPAELWQLGRNVKTLGPTD